MSSIINCALIALSSITGKSLTNKPLLPMTKENYELAYEIAESDGSSDQMNINNVRDIYGLSGINEYSLLEFDNSYAIIDKTLNHIIESGPIEESPYYHLPNDFLLKNGDEYFYYDYIANEFVSTKTHKNLTKFEYRSTDNWQNDLIYCTSANNPNATFIDNALYFDNLNAKYGANTSKVCGIIASEILLGYYDTFQNDLIIDDAYEEFGYYEALSSVTLESPGTDRSGSNKKNQVRDLLISKSIACNGENPVTQGMTGSQVGRLIDYYLDYKNVDNTITAWPLSLNYNLFAESCINNNKPFIAFIPDHFVVVYGYDDDFYYLVTGWWEDGIADTAKLPRSWFYNQGYTYALSLDITDHIHSNNYYYENNHGLYCGCGYHHSNRLIMNPSDWGFEEQYYFYNRSVVHTKNNLQFSSHRLRTGFIQSSVINLSPRRSGAGSALFDVLFSNHVYEFNVNLAWWGQNENETDGFAYLEYHLLDEADQLWHAYIDDYLANPINFGYQNLGQRRYILPNNCNGIKFNLGNLAVGNQNRGRLSLGTLIFDYFVN